MTDSKLLRPQMPRILGIAHFGVYTDSLDNTAAFFRDYFGYAEPYRIEREGEPTTMFVKINDRQYIEFVEDTEHRVNKYRHTAFETEDAEAMLAYLKMMGVGVPAEVRDSGWGYKYFFIKDFSGNDVEFVEYIDKGLLADNFGKDLPDTRISDAMRHSGWVCKDFAKDLAFYSFILGFKEYWRGGPDENTSQWIKLGMIDSPRKDYIEIMLYDHELVQWELGCLNHIGLDVDDVPAAYEKLMAKPIPEGCTPGEPMKIGACGYGQSNFLNIDLTRFELMSKLPIDGKGTPTIYGTPVRFDE